MKTIIKKPIMTEKNAVYQAAGVYVFEVDLKADKKEIRSAVEKYFRVKVSSVNTVVCRGRGKANKFGMSAAPHWKKAFVKLAAGEKIRIFEGA